MTHAAAVPAVIAQFARPFAVTCSASTAHLQIELGDLPAADSSMIAKTQIVRSLSADPDQSWFWRDEWQAGEREASNDIAAGRGTFYASSKDFLESL